MEVKVYTLNSFAKEDEGGNPAGVVLDCDYLLENDMQKIAAKVGFSETAFVKKSNNADYKIVFFTPNGEVDLCGHATIGAFYLLAHLGIIKAGKYTQETKAGILQVECRNNNVILMNQRNPEFGEILDKEEIAYTLNIDTNEIVDNFPIQIVSTGLKDILVPIKSLKTLYDIKPNFHKISQVSKLHDAIGYHLFTMETEQNSTAHCRNFAPLYDIDEEAATGTSSGALSCYLYKYGIVSEESAKGLIFEQGYSMKRPSEILAQLTICNKKIKEVKIGGIASDVKEKIIRI